MLTGRLIAWKHLFYKTEDEVYAMIVKNEAQLMLEIVKKYKLNDKLHLIYFLNGTSSILLDDFAAAEKEFGLSVKLYPSDSPEKADWMGHLGSAMYANGKKEEGLKINLEAIELLKNREKEINNSFLYHVWLSGAYLRTAKLLEKDNPQLSQVYLDKTKKILDSDKELVIRQEQYDNYIKQLK